MPDPASQPPPLHYSSRASEIREAPLGTLPDDVAVIAGPAGVIEALLRHPRRLIYHLPRTGSGGLIAVLLTIAVGCSVAYGGIVGAFSGGMQLWAAPLKIALGLIGGAAICLPSLYIFACLAGSQARLVDVLGVLAGLLALTTVLLIGFAPVAWIFSQSTNSVAGMGILHLLFGIVSIAFGARFLRAGFRLFGIRSEIGINVWLLVFLLVLLQMTAALRPLIGTADQFFPSGKKFFLTHWAESMGANDVRR
jgi:hypothetical protein